MQGGKAMNSVRLDYRPTIDDDDAATHMPLSVEL
jgi:hypothetical protein